MTKWHPTVARQNHGQIVENAYGWVECELYWRRVDRSDPNPRPEWRRADPASRDRLLREDYDPNNGDPGLSVSWVQCSAPSGA